MYVNEHLKHRALSAFSSFVARTIDVTFHLLKQAFLVFLGMVLCFLLIASPKAEAKVIYYGSEIETVTIARGGPTIFRFDQEVKTISHATKFTIKPEDAQNPNYAVLVVTPRFNSGKNKVTFILANGAVITTSLVITPSSTPEKIDSFYDFLPKESLVGPKDSKGHSISDLELMKAMIGWQSIVGYKIKNVQRTINTGNIDLSAKLVQIYVGPKYNGYIFKIRNLSSKKRFKINPEFLSLGSPNQAILSQVDNEELGTMNDKKKKVMTNTTFLRVVSKATSVYYNINLPVGPIQAKPSN